MPDGFSSDYALRYAGGEAGFLDCRAPCIPDCGSGGAGGDGGACNPEGNYLCDGFRVCVPAP
jgi:hypothetical protein